MDIGRKGEYPTNELEPSFPHTFYFDGVECASMEGLLQAFRIKDRDEQLWICKLSGSLAIARGTERIKSWIETQTLWWDGKTFVRTSFAYQELLGRAYACLWENERFRTAVIASCNAELTYSAGQQLMDKCTITQIELCDILTRLRRNFFVTLRRLHPADGDT